MKNTIKTTGKKLVSLVIAVCIICSALVIAIPTQASALSLSGIPVELIFEYGCKGISLIGGKLAEYDSNDDLKVAVDTFTKLIVNDSTKNKVDEIKELCEDILEELTVMKADIRDYTAEISSAIERQNADKARDLYDQKWESDVIDQIPDEVESAYKAYVKYFVIKTVKLCGLPSDEDQIALLDDFWVEHFHQNITDVDFSDKAVETAYAELENAYIAIYDSIGTEAAKDEAYKSAYIFNEFYNTIKNITDNFVYDDMAYTKRQYTVVECAATDAYYTLPFSHQQYEYITAVAKNQIMHAVLLEMALNEYLAMQGTYLNNNLGDNEDWNKENILHYNNSANKPTTTSYETCMETYSELVNNTMVEASYIFSSEIHINTYAYTGETSNLVMSFDQYMRPEDVTTVELEIQGYIESMDYKSTINRTEAGGHEGNKDLGNTVTTAKYITPTLKFHRVMSGGTNPEIFYILDSEQFTDQAALDFMMSKFRVKRYGMYGGSDSLYGDLYLPSADFLNLIKNMSDGVNCFSVPEDPDSELANLIDVPYYGAVCKYDMQTLLEDYLPEKGSDDTYILTSQYSNNLDVGGWTCCKYASFTLGNITTSKNNNGEIKTETVSFEDLSNGHNMAVILTNNSDTYKQNATAKVCGSVGDIRIVTDGKTISAGETSAIESGKEISVQFKIDDKNTFESLKLIRNNAETSETVLINGVNELESFGKTDGYYSFEMRMPYSDCTFILETNDGLQQDENGNYLINDYEDLCTVASLVNSGVKKYSTASYVLTSDIDCKDEDWTKRDMIGTKDVQFNGTFDGQGHTIDNLNSGADVEGTDSGHVQGLFGILGESAVVKNLNVKNATVWSDDSVIKGSAVIAKQNNGTIINCTVSDSRVQLGNSDYLGGITGLNNGLVENCKVENSTIVRRWGGCSSRTMGTIAEVNNGTVKNCSASNCTFKNGVPPEENALIATGNTPV